MLHLSNDHSKHFIAKLPVATISKSDEEEKNKPNCLKAEYWGCKRVFKPTVLRNWVQDGIALFDLVTDIFLYVEMVITSDARSEGASVHEKRQKEKCGFFVQLKFSISGFSNLTI